MSSNLNLYVEFSSGTTDALPTLLFSGSLLPSVYICIASLYLLSIYLFVVGFFFLSDLSTVVSFLSIYFANSDLGLMVLILANSVFEGVGFLFLPLRTLIGVLVFL